VTLRTPDEAGQYLLIWFVFVREDGIRELEDSFSPGIMCFIGPTTQPPPTPAGTSALQYTGAIQEERRLLNAALVPGRWELWSAALKMLRQRPLLGMGPDNFRILKWRYMDLPKGDETILANSLYLELLAGSGILGLVSFLWLSWELARRMMASAAVADRSTRGIAFFGMTYLAAFLLHGMVDYFLKFTPTFLLFWLVLGTLSRRAQQGGTLEAGV
jgi:O-antigen ligase